MVLILSVVRVARQRRVCGVVLHEEVDSGDDGGVRSDDDDEAATLARPVSDMHVNKYTRMSNTEEEARRECTEKSM